MVDKEEKQAISAEKASVQALGQTEIKQEVPHE